MSAEEKDDTKELERDWADMANGSIDTTQITGSTPHEYAGRLMTEEELAADRAALQLKYDDWIERGKPSFVDDCVRTESPVTPELIARASNARFLRILHSAMGASTEAGEMLDNCKKHLFYGKPLDIVNLKEEAGDLLWYLGILCSELDIPFCRLMELVIDKLRARYPDKFTSDKAINRNLEAERKILETPTDAELDFAYVEIAVKAHMVYRIDKDHVNSLLEWDYNHQELGWDRAKKVRQVDLADMLQLGQVSKIHKSALSPIVPQW